LAIARTAWTQRIGGHDGGTTDCRHTAAMECYRRAMIGERTFRGRREHLAQANKLSRTSALLLEALDRRRGRAGKRSRSNTSTSTSRKVVAIIGNVEGGSKIGESTPCT